MVEALPEQLDVRMIVLHCALPIAKHLADESVCLGRMGVGQVGHDQAHRVEHGRELRMIFDEAAVVDAF